MEVPLSTTVLADKDQLLPGFDALFLEEAAVLLRTFLFQGKFKESIRSW